MKSSDFTTPGRAPDAIGRAVTRRRFLAAAVAGATTCFGAGAWARTIEPQWLKLSRITVPMSNLDTPIRLAHLSDFHLSDVVPLAYIESAVRQAVAAGPDVVCLTGDYITRRLRQADAYRTVLRRLADAAPTFAVMGNHDGGSWAAPRGGYTDTGPVHTLLTSAGIQVLDNRAVEVPIGNDTIGVIGVGDLWSEQLQPDTAFAGAPAHPGPRILLSHNPDSKSELADASWDLMVCGHTHGGQLRLPILGTPFAPVIDHSIVHGLHRWHHRWIHVTSGVGNIHGVRFNCRPEVAILTLVPSG